MDYQEIKAVVDRYEAIGISMPVAVTNEVGEWGILGWGSNGSIRLEVAQDNDWIRVHEYYPDGTVTETYEK